MIKYLLLPKVYILSIKREKYTAKIKCLLFSPKPQKFHTTEITDYTINIFHNYEKWLMTTQYNDSFLRQ
jgi:hypothetical protein